MIKCKIKHENLSLIESLIETIERNDDFNGHIVREYIGTIDLRKNLNQNIHSNFYKNLSGLRNSNFVKLAKNKHVVKVQRNIASVDKHDNNHIVTDVFIEYVPENHSTNLPSVTNKIIDPTIANVTYDMDVEVLLVCKSNPKFVRYVTVNSQTALTPLDAVNEYCDNIANNLKFVNETDDYPKGYALDFYDDFGEQITWTFKDADDMKTSVQSFRVIKLDALAQSKPSAQSFEEKVIQYCLDNGTGIHYSNEPNVENIAKTTEKERQSANGETFRYVDNETIDCLVNHPHPEQVEYAINNHIDLCDFDRWQATQTLLFTATDNQLDTIPYDNAAEIIDALWKLDIEVIELTPDLSLSNIMQSVKNFKKKLVKTVPDAFAYPNCAVFTEDAEKRFINYIESAPITLFTQNIQKHVD